MKGLRIGVTGARRGGEFADALARRGAQVLCGPTLVADVPVDAEQLAAQTDAVLAAQPSWVAASTGAGMQAWVAAAGRQGRERQLRALLGEAGVAARSLKAVGALQVLNIVPVFVSPQETDADVADWLAGRVAPGEVVAVQRHGSADGGTDPYACLSEMGAAVLGVTPGRCQLPADRGPARRLVRAACRGDLDVLVATSPPAVRNLFTIADETDLRPQLVCSLRERVAVAAVGPVTAGAFEEAGVPVAVMPRRFRSEELVRALEGWAERHTRGWGPPAPAEPAGIELVPETRVARVGPRAVVLSEREFAVLAALVRRPEVVCGHDLLAREAWGHRAPDDPSLVKHQISRLRRKLGPAADALQTVRNVGYRYAPGIPARS